MEGLKKGLNFKVLILNPQKVEYSIIDLRPLQLKIANTIDHDLRVSVPCFISICDEAKDKKYSGSFEVKICDFVIFNSITSFTQERKRRIILDFSFSEIYSDKYQQYYECDPNDNGHFCNKLYNFYKGFYEQSDFYIRYYQEKISRSENFVKSFIEEDVDILTQKYLESEEIRNNESKNFLFIIPQVFDSIKNTQSLPSPLSVQLELTNKCNTNCLHCKRYTWPNGDEMSTDQIKSILDELERLRVQSVTLSGGEPTLKQDFIDILRYANSKRLNLGVLTNGLEINDALAKALIKYSDWVRISLDGSNLETYQKIRGESRGFEKVIESINNLERAKRENKTNCKIGICYSIQKLNIDDVPKMIEFVERLNLSNKEKVLTFKFVHGRNGFLHNVVQLNEFYNNTLSSDNPIWNRMTNIQYLRKFIDSYSKVEDIANGLPLNSYYQSNNIRCFTPYLFSLIDAFGDVYPCCFLYYDNDTYDEFKNMRERYRLGRVSEIEPFGKIWSGNRYRDLRNNLKIINVGQFPECRECLRHYFHNTFLTELFDKYESYIQIGDEGKNLFKEVLKKYPLQKVWL
ncbi:MAG: radical SAM protein [bacterium]